MFGGSVTESIRKSLGMPWLQSSPCVFHVGCCSCISWSVTCYMQLRKQCTVHYLHGLINDRNLHFSQQLQVPTVLIWIKQSPDYAWRKTLVVILQGFVRTCFTCWNLMLLRNPWKQVERLLLRSAASSTVDYLISSMKVIAWWFIW